MHGMKNLEKEYVGCIGEFEGVQPVTAVEGRKVG